jgi:hypothetical protein
MIDRRLGMLSAAALLLAASAAAAEPCPTGPRAQDRATAAGCKPAEQLRPYDPDAERAGRRPGFVDLGNGTEVRVGGRTRLDYDVRR